LDKLLVIELFLKNLKDYTSDLYSKYFLPSSLHELPLKDLKELIFKFLIFLHVKYLISFAIQKVENGILSTVPKELLERVLESQYGSQKVSVLGDLYYTSKESTREESKRVKALKLEQEKKVIEVWERKLDLIEEVEELVESYAFLYPKLMYLFELKDFIEGKALRSLYYSLTSEYQIPPYERWGNILINLENNTHVAFQGNLESKKVWQVLFGELSLEDLYREGFVRKNGKYHENYFVFYRYTPILRENLLVTFSFPGCNLDCVYCYKGEKKNVRVNTKPFEVFLEKALPLYKKIQVAFHGGEPLLCFKEIKSIVEKFPPWNRGIYYSIQTNATLLSEEIVEFLKYYNFGVGVSLDGPRDFHDKLRVFPNKKGSFEEVMRGIRLLKEYGVKFGVITVLSKANNDYKRLYKFYAKNEIEKVKINPLTPFSKGYSSFALNSEEMFEFYKGFLEYSVKKYSRGYPKVLEQNVYYLAKLLLKGKNDCMQVPCMALRGHLSLNYDGSLFYRDEFVGFEEYKLGNVLKQSLEEIILKNLPRIFDNYKFKEEKCLKCGIRHLCPLACKSRLRLSYFWELCKFYKKFIPWLLNFMYSNPEFLEVYGLKNGGESNS